MSARRLLIGLTLIAALMFSASPASAAKYDLNLGRYFSATCDINCAQANYDSLMKELGQITAPIFLAPAETLGLNGFTFGIEGSVVPIQHDQEFWTAATEGTPGSVLFIPHIHIRKGLPFSFEVGTQLSYIPDSELFTVGAEVKWAVNEGFHYIPDLSVRIAINHTVGAKDFELTTGGWDVALSKAFGIAGMLSLTPYAGYNMLFVHSSSHVVIEIDQTVNPPVFENWVFNEVTWNKTMFHRFFFGLRLTTFIFQLAVEGVFTMDANDAEGISMFNFKLGFDY